MKTLLILLGLEPRSFSAYRIAEGEDEPRIRREILRGIQKRCRRASPDELFGTGAPFPEAFRKARQNN